MGKIRRLASHEIAQIAAGEVIERPANVVKELMENSIDAGATQITIQLERAGKQSIEIIDNGIGMTPDDAYLAVTQHATSKLPSIDELNTVTTLGFRGEALATIAAVSHFTLQTRPSEQDAGVKLIYNNGKLVADEPVGIAVGTQICVEHLFSAIPARKKFLKTDDTELRAILQTVQALAFAYPHIHIKISHNGKTIYNIAPVDSLAVRTAQLYGSEYGQATTLFETIENDIQITVAATDATFLRYDRSHIVLLVNKRWVKNHALARAVLNGYGPLLPHGKYPTVTAHIHLACSEVDVNAHPRKEEVRFLHPKQIENAVTHAVMKALEEYTRSSLRGAGFEKADANLFSQTPTSPAQSIHQNTHIPSSFKQYEKTNPYFLNSFDEKPIFALQASLKAEHALNSPPEELIIIKNEDDTPNQESETQNVIGAVRDYPSLIGYLANTYLLVEKADGLFIVDQHAAHERVMYHRFATKFETIITRRFSVPELVRCDQTEIELIHKHQEIFEALGVGLQITGEREVALIATPSFCSAQQAIELCRMIFAEALADSLDKLDIAAVTKYLSHAARARMSCIAAVKAGTQLRHDEQIKLLQDLQETPDNTHCPHGRPTGWVLTRYEIEKRFRRIGN